MPRLNIFRAGRHVDMSGKMREFSAADLDAIARTYDPARHEAPLVIGHPALDAPVYGRVKSLSADRDELYAELHRIDPEFAQLVRDGRYKKVSASFYEPTAAANPVPGVYYLQHVGFLGAQAPAVKGLRQAEFAEDAGMASFAAPHGYTVDPAGLELHNKALAYMREHPDTDYVAAVAAVDS